jgi:DNA-binding ferritin-like protein
MGVPGTEPQAASGDESIWSPNLDAVREISATLNVLLADLFTLHLKTKNFHWHVRSPQFRDHHLMFDEQADHIFDGVDLIAERVRKVGARRSAQSNMFFDWRVSAETMPKWSRLSTC